MNLRKLTNSRGLALACVLFLILALSACGAGGGGGGGGDRVALPEPPSDACDSTSVPEDGGCRTFAVRIDDRAATPFTENGEPVELEVVLFRPPGEGRYPTVLFNHGSTGNGSDPSRFGETFTHKGLARYFVERGFMVAFLQRRGRGRSDGLYDEGFTPNRSGYSCEANRALAGADRAMADMDAATDWLRGRADVDTTFMLVGGVSRGGILSVAYVARRPEVYRAAINFVGGWSNEGCGDYAAIHRTLFTEGAGFPGTSLWLYARNDSFYSIAHSRSNFDEFTYAGGMGVFELLEREPTLNGHFVINDPELWTDAMDRYLTGL